VYRIFEGVKDLSIVERQQSVPQAQNRRRGKRQERKKGKKERKKEGRRKTHL